MFNKKNEKKQEPSAPDVPAKDPQETAAGAAVQRSESTELTEMDFSADAGSGFEDMSTRDLAIPFLQVLQTNSPQCDEESSKYVEGAKAGMWFNTVTESLFPGKQGIYGIPCHFQKVLVEWTPREQGGGLVGHHKIDDPIVSTASRNNKNQLVLPNGNILVETGYYYFIQLHGGTHFHSIISMTSTQLKKSRKWNSQMQALKKIGPNGVQYTPPMFSQIYKLTTAQEENSKGKWHGILIDHIGDVQKREDYEAAKKFHLEAKKGSVRVAAPPQEEAPDSSDDSGDDGVPF